jgi:hypothetical protein
MLDAARAAYRVLPAATEEVEGDGNVAGEPLDAAHQALESYFKPDEASAFSLWASPRSRPKVVVVYFEARRGRRPIWVAVQRDGTELRSASQLPRGAFKVMRAISEEDDDWLVMWPDMIDAAEDSPSAPNATRATGAHRKAAAPIPSHSHHSSQPDASVPSVRDASD